MQESWVEKITGKGKYSLHVPGDSKEYFEEWSVNSVFNKIKNGQVSLYEYLTNDERFSFIAKIYECGNNSDARVVFGKIEYNLSSLADEVYSSTRHGYPGFEVVSENSITKECALAMLIPPVVVLLVVRDNDYTASSDTEFMSNVYFNSFILL
ncbi:hypothetical protein QO588_002544 [Salmonella enterica]|uniref:Uncharacterized protein n=1 Tax=Citrobacter meridianamericanus TaxID=2894201 RepID=A0ABT1BH92_9ENTR|nr:hypothetical protein [Citrobacter meridianamericanus]EBP9815851.1 hypothetical protein [Salmonella enterica]EGZ4030187.1 hypothetical protein [Salmonella enterica subsp. enterica serovar Javiana]HCX7088926.1 hypothetical protein [Salmonella enterica subsp. enterica]ECE1413758.1 hypothetical protein [Salmonella enterica]ELS7234273.1 hypothetical protein [Salmonella enterica]